jgi:hypothetical protein
LCPEHPIRTLACRASQLVLLRLRSKEFAFSNGSAIALASCGPNRPAHNSANAHEVSETASEFRGYFDLYNIPFKYISLYDFTEKKSPFGLVE